MVSATMNTQRITPTTAKSTACIQGRNNTIMCDTLQRPLIFGRKSDV